MVFLINAKQMMNLLGLAYRLSLLALACCIVLYWFGWLKCWGTWICVGTIVLEEYFLCKRVL